VPSGHRRMEGLRPALGRPERFCFRFCRGARISLSGLEGRSHQSIETREAQRKTGYSSAYDIACLYADLGDKDEAFRWLNIAYQERDIGLLRLKTDFRLDSLRSDPRLAGLVRKVGLPH